MSPTTTNPLEVVELRTRRRWLAFLGLFVPAMGFVAVAALVQVYTDQPAPKLDRVVVITLISGSLILFLVVPAALLFVRAIRGIPDVRLDLQGVVWGRDRSRDLSIDWGEIGRVTTKVEETRYMTDRVFVLYPATGRTGRPPRTVFSRVAAAVARWRYGSPFVISTAAANQPWERVRQVLAARLPSITIEGEPKPT